MNGPLIMPSASGIIAADSNYCYIRYYDSTGMIRTADIQSNPNNGIDLVEYSPKSADKFEMFSLPNPDTNRTTNITYNILTTKTFNPGEDFASKVTFYVSVTNVQFYRLGNICVISYQSVSQQHSKGEVLFTLPSGYRPSKQVYAACTVYGTSFGVVQILPNGDCQLNEISNDPATGRIYCNISYFI